MKARSPLVQFLGFALAIGVGFTACAQDAADREPAFLFAGDRLKAEPFDLSDVRISGGVFKTNEDLDAKYILSLDPDRLLHMFRVTAGLPSTAKPLGGWEETKGGLRGHFIGHYLSACAEMYAATGDADFRDRGTYVVAELGKCQDAIGTGYLSAFPATVFDTLETQYGHVWAPYYTMHKIMAGLVDQYHYCGNKQALEIAEKMADYFRGRMAKLTPEQIDKILHTVGPGPQNEFGGMSEVLHNLYAITKKQEYLDFADVFDRQWILNPLSMGRDELKGLHANTHIPQIIGAARHYELTGDDRDQRAANYFWSQMTQHHSYVNGSNSRGEMLSGPDIEAKNLDLNTSETCNVYNMLKLTEHVFAWSPDAATADYYELALYNHILGSIEPGTGMTTYFMPMQGGHFKIFGTPEDSFWCCNGTGMENHAKYGAAIYFHDKDSLWVNLFIPSQLSWTDKGLTLTQATDYPEKETTVLDVKVAVPRALKILLRVPAWTQGATVKVNGQAQRVTATPGSYVALDRTWNSGDQIEFTVPMSLHLHRAEDDANQVAVMYGPLVLAGDLGMDGVPGNVDSKINYAFFKVPNVPVPALAGNSSELNSWIKRRPGDALAFQVQPSGGGAPVNLVPFYKIDHQRYAIYWPFTDGVAQAAP